MSMGSSPPRSMPRVSPVHLTTIATSSALLSFSNLWQRSTLFCARGQCVAQVLRLGSPQVQADELDFAGHRLAGEGASTFRSFALCRPCPPTAAARDRLDGPDLRDQGQELVAMPDVDHVDTDGAQVDEFAMDNPSRVCGAGANRPQTVRTSRNFYPRCAQPACPAWRALPAWQAQNG